MALLRCLILWVLAVGITSCQYNEVVVEDIRDFQIRKMEINRIFLGFKVKLKNPNSYQIKVSNTDLNCTINGRNMGNLRLDNKLLIPPGNDNYLTVNSSLTTKGAAGNVLSILLSSLISQSVEIHLTGDVQGGLFIFPKTIEIDHRERVDLNRSGGF